MKNLIVAVFAQVNDKRNFHQYIRDVRKYGAEKTGVPGFIYHEDTVKFSKKYLPLIKEALAQDCEDGNVVSFVQGFCPDNTQEEISQTLYASKKNTKVLNNLAWYALERVAMK
jgi:pyruvate/oxaloacetate carboxyltransferase